MFDTFGDDRLIFGSDWPNAAAVDNLAGHRSGRAAAEEYFWKNSVAAYKWIHRDPRQPQLPGN